jgi:hypothetical protein
MREKLGIVFLHHNTNEITRRNLASIKRHNRDATIITISAGEPFNGGYSLEETPNIKRLHSHNPSRSSDWLVCSWFVRRKEKCHKWWIAEWDTFANTSVKSYYKAVWNHPFVASSVRLRYREPEWGWFGQAQDLPETYRAYVMGAVPFIYLVSEQVMQRVCSTLLSAPIRQGNGELRFATVANRCGFPPCGYSPPNDRITWIQWHRLPREKTIFHPVKELNVESF